MCEYRFWFVLCQNVIYYCTALSTVFDRICALQVFIIISIIVKDRSKSHFLKVDSRSPKGTGWSYTRRENNVPKHVRAAAFLSDLTTSLQWARHFTFSRHVTDQQRLANSAFQRRQHRDESSFERKGSWELPAEQLLLLARSVVLAASALMRKSTF